MGISQAIGNGGGRGSSAVFIGALDPQVTEEEIMGLASSQYGFVRLTCKGLGQPRGTAWAQYDSAESAAFACESLRYVPVPSMGKPANVEMAKSETKGRADAAAY